MNPTTPEPALLSLVDTVLLKQEAPKTLLRPQLTGPYTAILIPFCCQDAGTSMLVTPLQAQTGTNSGYLVCPEAGTLHPPGFQNITLKGQSTSFPAKFIFFSTIKTGINNLFFPITDLFCFPNKCLMSPGRQLTGYHPQSVSPSTHDSSLHDAMLIGSSQT